MASHSDKATLVAGRAVLTGRLDVPEIEDGGVLVRDGAIVDIGASSELRRAHPDAIDVGGRDYVVMPGLVSAHQHGGGVSSTQLGCPDQPFEQWLLAMFGVSPLDVRLDTTYHAIRLLENGITSTIHSHYTRDPTRYADEVGDILAGYQTVGTRVAFAACFLDRNLLTYGEDEAFLASLPDSLADIGRSIIGGGIAADDYVPFVRHLAATNRDPRQRILFGPIAPQWSSPHVLRLVGEAVADGFRAQLHLLETVAQRVYLDHSIGGLVVAWLDELGLLGPRVSFAHGTHLRDAEMRLLAERGSGVVLNPGCNLRLGNGTAPVAGLRRAGVTLAIGTDDMTIGDDDDLFGEMRLVRGIARSGGVELPASEVITMATLGGATVMGLEGEVGSIERGKRADLVLLNAKRLFEPAAADDLSITELVVTRARASDVSTVLLDGELVLQDGQLNTLDREALVAELGEVARTQDRDPDRRSFAIAMREVAQQRYAWQPRMVVNDG